MNKFKQVMKRLEEEDRSYSIRLLGDKKNKLNGFSILMHTRISSDKEHDYHGISKKFVDLLKEAEIKFKIL